MKYIITLDIGTTSVKTSIFDESFNLCALNSEEYELLTPGKEHIELNPDKYWDSTKKGIRNVIKTSGVDPSKIAAITVTSQGETLIPVNKQGTPLHNAVVWLDSRATTEAAFISSVIDADAVYRHTGLSEIGPSTPISKVLWFKNNMPELYKDTHKFLLVLDFLVYRLTGRYVTDNSVASSTGYVDINSDRIWEKVLDITRIDSSVFPEIIPCGSLAGKLSKDASAELGLSMETVVCMGAMDQISSALGAGNVNPGIVTETTGTALVIGTTVTIPDYDNGTNVNISRHYGNRYLILPYCPNAAIILKWFKDEFCHKEMEESKLKNIPVYRLLDELAEKTAPTANGTVILPHFSGMLTPEINPMAKGAIFGIGLETKKGDIIRAILESIAYMLRENLEMLENMGISINQVRSIGGGSKSRLWNSIKADITGKEILTMEQEETTSLGAAIMGAVATGIYENVDDACAKAVKAKDCYTPCKANIPVYNKSYKLFTSLYSALKPLYIELYKINS